MKRYASLMLVAVGFIAGIAFVYSCSSDGTAANSHVDGDASAITSVWVENLASGADTQWINVNSGEIFILTDVFANIRFQIEDGSGNVKFKRDAGESSFSFASGIPFEPGEEVVLVNTGISPGNFLLSGYMATTSAP